MTDGTVPGCFWPTLLDGEVAVVTGGSAGIGLGIATAFAAHGADVVLASRSAERLARAAATVEHTTGRPCRTVVCDVRLDDDVARLRCFTLDMLGRITILVNNAAANFQMPARRMTRRAFSTVVDADLVGTFNVTLAFVEDMIGRRHGSILNVVVPAVDRGMPGFAHCGAAKAGIVSLTRTWAREWGPEGVRVNAVGPGPVPTAGAAEHMLGLAEGGAAFAGALDAVPLGRLGTVDDIALASVFLCSRAASWITGVNLDVDGGLYLT